MTYHDILNGKSLGLSMMLTEQRVGFEALNIVHEVSMTYGKVRQKEVLKMATAHKKTPRLATNFSNGGDFQWPMCKVYPSIQALEVYFSYLFLFIYSRAC